MFKKIFFLVIILAVGGYLYLSVFVGRPNPMAMMMAGGPMPVTVANVIKKDITLWDEFSGRLTAVDHVDLRPRVAGMVESVHFEDGQFVKKGDLLFTIDPRPYKAALNAAQASYHSAKAEFDRAEPLLAEKAISQRSFDQRKSALAAAMAELTQARLNVDYTTVQAPISGKVGRREVTPGNLVNVGQPILTTVVSQHPIYADFEADERHFLKYIAAHGSSREALDSVRVMLEMPGSTENRSGRIQSFDNQLDVSSGTIRVRAAFDNEDGRLIPGMFARIRVPSGDSGSAMLVANSAIGTDQDKKFVYVVDGEGTVQYREVTIGAAHERLRVVTKGLAEGETIIVKGIQRIKPGMPVKPQPVSMQEAVAPAPEQPTEDQPEQAH